MKHRVTVTVLKTTLDKELQAQYLAQHEKPTGYACGANIGYVPNVLP